MFKIKKYQILLFSLFVCSVSLLAQYQNATEEQKKEIISKISQASGSMNTMQCEFTQVKELSFIDDQLSSKGKMFYKKTNKIRWEYAEPYQYVFSMDGKNGRMTVGGKTTTVPANQSKLFNELSKVMVSSVSGTGLVDSPDFDSEFFVGSNDDKVVLIPKQKEVKDLFSSIQLYIGKSDNRIHSVELIEKSGDKTTITLKNIQVNTAIDDKIFSQ